MANTRLMLSQKLHLRQKVFLQSSLLCKPITAIDRTIDAIIENPELVAQVPQTSQVELGGARPLNYSSLLEKLIGNEKGSVRASGTDQIVSSSGNAIVVKSNEQVIAQPDISYVVRGYGEFRITHSEHFKTMEPTLKALQVPKNVQPFLRWLIKQRNWIADTLLQTYIAIGKKQAGFLLYLQPQHLVALPRTRLPSETGIDYSESTYSRLLQGRSVKIESLDETAVLPVAFLLPTLECVTAYDVVPKMNDLLNNEFLSKLAFSDNHIAQKMGGKIARRTVAKYRLSAEIPNKSERQSRYNQGIVEPYKVKMAIEAYLPNR